ncbi:diaminopimelate decarboxylase [Blautia schinkii]|nr:diaminopimelate decarboxylase [Blautia schinkii]
MLNETQLQELARRYVSFYLYDEKSILESTAQLIRDFEGIQFLYSIKSNHNPDVVQCILSNGFGVDAASLKEVEIGSENGLGQTNIFYSAPGKTERDIQNSIHRATLIADSLNEVERINQIAGELGLTVSIGVRINPNFTFDESHGVSSKFGIDEEQALAAIPLWQTYPNIKITGIHVHLRSQELNKETLLRYYRKMFLLAETFQTVLGCPLEFLNMGSGMGIEYSQQDTPLNTVWMGQQMQKMLQEFRLKFPQTRVLIEVGRYAVGKSGSYVTRVLDKKTSYGNTYVILANTLNGFLRPSIARLVNKYATGDFPVSSEPLFTALDAFAFLTIPSVSQKTETVTLVGNLCTATDVIAEGIILPALEPGDLIIITNAGSYGAVLSPMQFSSLDKPAELFLSQSGKIYENGHEICLCHNTK